MDRLDGKPADAVLENQTLTLIPAQLAQGARSILQLGAVDGRSG